MWLLWQLSSTLEGLKPAELRSQFNFLLISAHTSVIVQTGSVFGHNLPHHGKGSFARCVGVRYVLE